MHHKQSGVNNSVNSISYTNVGNGNFEAGKGMRSVTVSIILGFLLFSQPVFSQDEITVGEYIETYKAIALQEREKYHIPASITLAQGILESGCGNSSLAREANNHFGIKCHENWTGKTFHQDDDEKNECFRKYKTAEESYQDHSRFLTSRDRYRFLFELDITDYRAWAYGLKQAGYATNPRYPEMLIRIIEENGLVELDQPDQGELQAVNDHPKEISNNPEPGTRNPESAIAPTTFEMDGRGGDDRVIFLNNGVKFVLSRDGDDCFKIAQEFGIYTWQIREYNELGKECGLEPGEKVYLEKKKASCPLGTYQVREGETLRSISQDFGVRMRKLAKMNGLKESDPLGTGQEIRLH
jgi:hypothetical protein